MRGGKITNVEAGRGVAACLVVLFHATKYYFGSAKYWATPALHGFFLFGHAGVEFFFVLSGFIMVLVHRQDVGKPSRVGAFAWKRFQRIYPFFWTVLAITVVAAWRFPALGNASYRDLSNIAQSAMLVGDNPLHAVVFVSWSLWHEVVFYGFCALAIWRPRVGIPAFAVWTLACAFLDPAGIATPWPGYMTEFINVLFAFGVGVALAVERWTIPAPWLVFACGLALFVGTGALADYTQMLPEWSTRLLFGSGAALLLAGGIELERSGRLTAPRWLVALGSASYAIYLTHILVLTLLVKIAAGLGLTRALPAFVAFPVLVGAAILGGVLVHRLVERPVLRATASLKRNLTEAAPKIALGAAAKPPAA